MPLFALGNDPDITISLNNTTETEFFVLFRTSGRGTVVRRPWFAAPTLGGADIMKLIYLKFVSYFTAGNTKNVCHSQM